MHVLIHDEETQLHIECYTCDDSYNPDIFDDLSNRVLSLYKDTLTTRAGVQLGISMAVDQLEQEGGEGD